MAKFCTNCGLEIAEGIAFCTNCGVAAPKGQVQGQITETELPQQTPDIQVQTARPDAEYQAPAAEIQTTRPEPAPVYQPRPQTYQQSQPQQPYYGQTYQQPPVQREEKPRGKYGVIPTVGFFGMMLLFGIPIIGFISCIIMAFAPKNENIKHFARSMLIFFIIAALICIVLAILLSTFSGTINDYLSQLTDGQLNSWQDVFGQFTGGEFNLGDMGGLPIE